jgi:hypothetical protein
LEPRLLPAFAVNLPSGGPFSLSTLNPQPPARSFEFGTHKWRMEVAAGR